MKNFKILILSLFVGGSIFTACVSTDIAPLDDSAYLDLTFLATADSSGNHKGGHGNRKMTEIDITTLPAAIKTYITTTYAGATIKHAAVGDSIKNYHVHIILTDGTNKGLKFDPAGKFLSEKTKSDKGGKGTKIETSALPKVITDYIAKTYSGGTIEKAYKTDLGAYGVEVTKADKTKLIVAFDKNGVFVSELVHNNKNKNKDKKGK